MRGIRRARAATAIASGAAASRHRSSNGVPGGTHGRSTRSVWPLRPISWWAGTTSGRSRRPRRSTSRSGATSRRRRGTGAATRSSSRSRRTASSGTWCGRSSARCSSCPGAHRAAARRARARARQGRRRRRGVCTSRRWHTTGLADSSSNARTARRGMCHVFVASRSGGTSTRHSWTSSWKKA